MFAFALLLSLFAWWPMLAAYPRTQGGDGAMFHQIVEAARVSLVRYRELPLWNVYQCGGTPLWDNPEGLAAAPLAWLAVPMGTTAAMMTWYVLHSALGFCCMYVLARRELRLSLAAALVASALWAFAGVQNLHLAGGHAVWGPFLLFPLALFTWRRAESDDRMAIATGGFVAWLIHEGGTYALPHLMLLLAAETVTRLWPAPRVVRIVRAAAIVGVAGFCLGASRFLPLIDQLRSHTRALGVETDALQWSTLQDVFLSRDHGRGVPGQEYVWPEFGDYIGPFLLALALLGIALSGAQNAWLVALLAFSFSLMLGHAGRYAPWHILRSHVYPFKEMRVPSRFVMEVNLCLAAFAGIGLDRIAVRTRAWVDGARARAAIRTGALVLALVGVGDMIGVGITWCAQCWPGAPENRRVVPSTRLYFGGPDLAGFLDQPRQNRGRLECWGEWGFEAGAPLWTGDLPQARSTSADAVVEVANRTQNTFDIEVDVKSPTRILVNSAYDRGWRTSVGTLSRENKQLVLDLPEGHHKVRLKYWPHGLTLGFVLTGLGLVGSAGFLAWDAGRRRRRARAAAPPPEAS